MEWETADHGFGPEYDQESRILILGSFPSVKSREQAFYYGHPQNRFWKVLAALADSRVPESIEERRTFLHRHHIAVYDAIESCTIRGSSDSSIRDVVPADIRPILEASQIGRRIFTNGRKAGQMYKKYIFPETGIPSHDLPSTSPANAAWSLDRLISEWGKWIDPDLLKQEP